MKKFYTFITLVALALSVSAQKLSLAVDGYTVVNTALTPRNRISVGLTWNFGSLTDYVRYNMRQYRSYDDVKQN